MLIRCQGAEMVLRLPSRLVFLFIRMVLLLLHPASTSNNRHCSTSECPIRPIRATSIRATSTRATSIRATSIRATSRCSRPLRPGTRSLSGQHLRPFCHVNAQSNATLETIAAVSVFSYSLLQFFLLVHVFYQQVAL